MLGNWQLLTYVFIRPIVLGAGLESFYMMHAGCREAGLI